MNPDTRREFENILIRRWYEEHREGWWERYCLNWKQSTNAPVPDVFIDDLRSVVVHTAGLTDEELVAQVGA